VIGSFACWAIRGRSAYSGRERATVKGRAPRLRLVVLTVPLALAAAHMAVFDRGLGGDGWATFAFLESAFEDRDLFLENNSHGVMNGLLRGPGGHLVMQYPPGVPLLDLLPFLAGRALDRVAPARWLAAGVSVPPAGLLPRRVFLEIAGIVAARNLAVLVGLLAILAALRRAGFGGKTVAAATALTLFGGPLVFYSLVGSAHAPTFALASFLLLVLVRDESNGSARGALAAGLLVGAATLVRYSAAALLPVVLLGVWTRPPWRRWGTALAGFAVPLALLPFYFHWHYGQWMPLGYGGRLRPSLASPWNILLSGHHGLFVFHPALLLAAGGLALGWLGRASSGSARLYRVATVWFLAVATVHGWWSEWANVGGYGQRFLIDALPALALGFAGLLSVPRFRPVVASALGAATLAGYLLFFAAVCGLARSREGAPWPQTLADYRPLLERPPAPRECWHALLRGSFLLRAVAGKGPQAER
jgi:hypothetical protein